MSDGKKYYWLKLKKDFFKRHDIQIIESLPNGKEYVLFYLKLLCESIDHKGMLRFSEDIPYTEDMLATITGTDKQIVYDAMKCFEDFGIVEVQEDGTFHLKQADRMIGEAETDDHTRESARLRAKAYRERKKEKCNSNVTVTLQSRDDNVIRNGEIDIEKEIDIDINNNIVPQVKEIIDYLNQKLGTHYKSSTGNTKSLIKARLNEGFKIDDFKKVIDKKYKSWHGDEKMNQYLRPQTLFGTKFESYLNEADKPVKSGFNAMMQHDYDFAALERAMSGG